MNDGLAEYVPRVYRLALQLTNDRHRAEDLTQETFLRAWRQRRQLKEQRATRVWLFRITANLWRDELRRGRAPAANTVSLQDNFTQSEPAPDSVVENREELSQVLKWLDALPPRQREVLYLFAVEELSLDEVSDILGLNKNAVKVNLSLARKRMREKIQRSPAFPKKPGF